MQAADLCFILDISLAEILPAILDNNTATTESEITAGTGATSPIPAEYYGGWNGNLSEIAMVMLNKRESLDCFSDKNNIFLCP